MPAPSSMKRSPISKIYAVGGRCGHKAISARASIGPASGTFLPHVRWTWVRTPPQGAAVQRYSSHLPYTEDVVAAGHRIWYASLILGLVASAGIWSYSQGHRTSNDTPTVDPIVDTNHLTESRYLNLRTTAYPGLILAVAESKLKREEMSTTFTPRRSTDVTRFDSLRLPSNNPVEDELSYGTGNVGDAEDWKFWGVYDGHAGWATSKVLRDLLTTYVAHEIRKAHIATMKSFLSPEAVDQAIKQAFTNLDEEIMSDGLRAVTSASSHAEAISRIAPARAGSCALLAAFDPASATLRIACTGDSRAVLGRRSKVALSQSPETRLMHQADALSIDQTGFNESERTRIDNEHPNEPKAIDTESGRLLGMAVTRAFGDHRWKWPLDGIEKCKSNFYGPSPRPEYHTPPYMTAEPVVTTTIVSSGDFLILASDGLWDHMSTEDAVECVSLWIDKTRQATKTGKLLQDTSDPQQTLSTAQVKNTESPSTFSYWYKGTPEHFTTEDDNAATHLVRNALGGSRRELFCSVLSMQAPESRMVRDDVTVQVIFFGDVVNQRE